MIASGMPPAPPARAPPFGRWTGPLVFVGVVAAALSLAIVVTYAPLPIGVAQAPHGPPFVFTNTTEVRAVGTSSGPGGCSAPGGNLVEYCYRIDLAYGVPMTGPFNFSGPGPFEYANTSVVAFAVDTPGTSAELSYVNVTLLDASGHLLAGVDATGVWTAYAPATLPLVIAVNDTLLLNFGTTSAAGDELVANEGAWGNTGAILP
jgi:hypothetical protein